MTDQTPEDYIREYAPELDPEEVLEFMAQHEKPEDEPGTQVAWATKLLRQRGESSIGERASTDHVAEEMRSRDKG